ncbi:phage holin family protein [Streptomyces wuyuanensis]|uniref:phage holin family protein n=1 Tax=Streptomyces wuyuanensis TaxID=1196353 RepID=UPI003D753591
MDTNPSDQMARAVREALADELREQTARQRRAALYYSAAGAVGLYAGAALVGCLVLLLSAAIPAWAAALIAAVALAVTAVLLRSAARKEPVPAGPAQVPPGTPPMPPRAPDPGAGSHP